MLTSNEKATILAALDFTSYNYVSYEGSWVYTTNDQGKCPGWYDQYK